jgi:alanine racemase
MAVFEAGISEPGEMTALQEIIRPTIGIFTNVGAAHDKNFISRIQKAGEKLKLFTKAHTLIYNPDYGDIREVIIRSEIGRNVALFTWSRKSEASLRITEVKKRKSGCTIYGIYENNEIDITIPFTDDASIENAIHCWATMLHMGYKQKVIKVRMLELQPIAMRLELKEGINDCTIINDSYNSDINSLAIALDFLNQQNQHQHKTLILSDIMQSNRPDMELYGEIAELLEKKNIHKLIGIGEGISRMGNLFKMESNFFKSTDDFIRNNPFSGFNNEAILLKGARRFEFERISKTFQKKDHETVLEINLNALVDNLNFYKSLTNTDTRIMAMVKAFSYGSGSYEISNTLQYHNIDYLSVAYADEGVELRKAGIRLPIMVMNPDDQSFDAILKHQLEPEIYSFRILGRLEEAIERNLLPKNKPVLIHLKFDTGMHRLGFTSGEVDALIDRISKNDLLHVQSVFSHLAASDDPQNDAFTQQQIALFTSMSDKVIKAFDYKILRHILNSAGISRFPEAQMDMVRLGISLYGIATDQKVAARLKNVSALKTSISQIKTIRKGETVGYNRNYTAEREMQVATIPLGYADGLSRLLSNGKGSLVLKEKRVPIVGNICMDMTMIDVTGMQAKEGDKVEVFGEHQSVSELADTLGTIPYEILSGISRRVKRVYFQE